MLTKYNDLLSYKIVDNGYEIYRDGRLWITQYDEYSNLYKGGGTYEENCLLHLKELEASIEAISESTESDTE